VAIAGATALLIGSGACAAEGDISKYVAGGITVGVANLPPYSSIDTKGEIVGVAPAVVKAVLAGLGIKVTKGTTATYSTLIPGLNAGRWDMVAASMSITAERCKQVLFSDPILFTTTSMAVPAGKPVFTTLAQWRDSGKSVGVQQGAHEITDGTLDGFKKVTQYPDLLAAVDALVAGRVDTLMNSTQSLAMLPPNVKAKLTISPPVDGVPIHPSGVAFRLDQGALQAAFNQELAKLKASGEHTKILTDHGFIFPKAGEGVTAASACVTEH
jgi:polar amino acid transport system substrate-binding protein